MLGAFIVSNALASRTVLHLYPRLKKYLGDQAGFTLSCINLARLSYLGAALFIQRTGNNGLDTTGTSGKRAFLTI